MSNELRLDSLFPGDEVQPGRFFFARIDNVQPKTSASYWIVMVVTPDLFPQSLAGEKSKAMRHVNNVEVYPCWLMEKGRL